MSSRERGSARGVATFQIGTLGLRRYHRGLGTLLMLCLLYLGMTGSGMQLVDLWALATAGPGADRNLNAIREGIDGPGNFAVIGPADYRADPLPPGYAYGAAFARLGTSGPAKYREIRMLEGAPTGQVLVGERLMRFSADSGDSLPDGALRRREGPQGSEHLTLKNFHRLHSFGDLVLVLNALVGLGLLAMVVTGTIVYFRLRRARLATGAAGFFWSGGGGWRMLHRGVAVSAAGFLSIVAVTGALLSIDSFCLGVYRAMHGTMAPGMFTDLSSPLPDAQVPAMLEQTLTAFRREHADLPIKVVRLRIFSGMPQGVVISGGQTTRQWVYSTASGRAVTATEPGYPFMGFPFGWHEHEIVKQIHRGDIVGMPGRVMDLLAGVSLIFLCVSGLFVYGDLWRRRRAAGRVGLLWR